MAETLGNVAYLPLLCPGVLVALRYEHLTRVRKVWVWIPDLPYAFISHSLSVPMKANECLVLLTETASCSPSIHRGVAAVLHHLASTPPNASSISAPVIWRKMGGGKGSSKEWKVQGSIVTLASSGCKAQTTLSPVRA